MGDGGRREAAIGTVLIGGDKDWGGRHRIVSLSADRSAAVALDVVRVGSDMQDVHGVLP